MSMGKPIVGQKIINNKEAYYSNKYFDEQFAYETPEEIVQQVENLLSEPSRLDKLGKSNARIFDAKMTPRQAVADIISMQLNRNGEPIPRGRPDRSK